MRDKLTDLCIAVIAGIIIICVSKLFAQLSLLIMIAISVIIILFIFFLLKFHPRTTKQKIIVVCLTIIVAILLIFAYSIIRTQQDNEYIEHRDSLFGALPWLNWILYDPVAYDPYKGTIPSEASIRKDLTTLRKHDFDGIITMNSKNGLQNIARIAKEVGMNMVIVGIWDLRDTIEIQNALSISKYADAYCIGHKGLNCLYTRGELERLLKMFIAKAKRPVTTSEKLANYEYDSSLIYIGDFLFPDVHSYWHKGQTPEHAVTETIELSKRAAQLALFSNKPVLLKMVSYPSGGADGLTGLCQ